MECCYIKLNRQVQVMNKMCACAVLMLRTSFMGYTLQVIAGEYIVIEYWIEF